MERKSIVSGEVCSTVQCNNVLQKVQNFKSDTKDSYFHNLVRLLRFGHSYHSQECCHFSFEAGLNMSQAHFSLMRCYVFLCNVLPFILEDQPLLRN